MNNMVVLERELNPYEKAIMFCKNEIAKWTATRPDLAKVYAEELDHWNRSYSQYLSVVR